MISIGCHTSDPEQDQGLQAADILIGFPELRNIIIIVPAKGRRTGRAVGNEVLLFRMYLIDQSLDSGFIEVYVGNSRKQAFDQQFIGIISRLSVAICRTGKADQSTCQLILKTCNICLFAANTSSAGTAFASGCLLTLETKHFPFHL